MITRFGYPLRTLLGDYARAVAGLGGAGAALFLPLHGALALLCGGVAALSLVFGLRTGLRHASRIELSESGIAVTGPLPRRLPWAELTRFRLRYFALRRDRKHGWMELTLATKGAKLSMESQIDGFESIVACAARAAAGLEIDQASLINLGALGIALPKQPAAEQSPAGPP